MQGVLGNALTGARHHVGNWPGVTVEKKEALLEYQGRQIRLVDLPGTYSLSPYSQEEIIARDYLVQERPDVIVDVVDATNLERNLYLTVQLLELGIPVIAALNIYDEAEHKGYRIDTELIGQTLGVKAVPTVATRKTGLDEVLAAILEVGDEPAAHRPRQLNYGPDVEAAAGGVARQLRELYPAVADNYPAKWLALKLMEGDRDVLQELELPDHNVFREEALEHLQRAHGEDLEAIMADARYAQAAGLVSHVPGGLGVFEGALAYLLKPYLSSAALVPALVMYRAVYYLLPLAVAVVVLAADELRLRRRDAARLSRFFGRVTERITPGLFAALTFFAGLVLLFSGATPAAQSCEALKGG